MKLEAKYFAENKTPAEVGSMRGTILPLAPDAPKCFEFGGDTIVMVMSRSDAENFYEQGHDNFDGCSDWQEYADALAEVSIGRRNYCVDIDVTVSQVVCVNVEGAEDEDDAYEKAREILSEDLMGYIDLDYLFDHPNFEDYDCTPE